MTFQALGLIAPILNALKEQGYESPSPIQEKAIPPALAGRDVLGCAQTGTGKTCAFAAPILQRLNASPVQGRPIRALILTPTRELAIQIGESFAAYGKHLKLRHTVIFGGVGQNPQAEALKAGVEILVATPGRLMDLYNQGLLTLDRLEIFVLDEADRMLDMGFIHDVRKILKWLPQKKQTMLFSATMPDEIADLVNSLLKNPARVAVDPVSSPVEAIHQSVYRVDRGNKTKLLAHLIGSMDVKNALVFTRTKHGANKVARDLGKLGISAAAIHGNKSQTARQQALSDFKAGTLRCLVATDIAARGLDIEELSHVFNYNLPEVPETYVHRIGRTGRAGRGGDAVAFCDFSELSLLKDIEKLIGRRIPQVDDHPYPMEVFESPKRDKNGRIINEEDEEARAAAREQHRAAREAKETAAEKQAAAAPKGAVEAPAQKGKKKAGAAKAATGAAEKRSTSAPSSPKVPETEPEEETTAFDYLPSRPKLTRPGTFLDTGDAMPCTEFTRPNPLDSDIIMDATARLLAPRRSLTLTPAMGREPAPGKGEQGQRKKKSPDSREEEKRSAKQKQAVSPGKKQAPPGQPEKAGAEQKKSVAPSPRKQGKPQAEETVQPGEKRSKRHSRHRKRGAAAAPQEQGRRQEAAAAPAGERKTGAEAPKKRRDRPERRSRGPAEEPQRSRHKDSTEQPSLMKPYYLDMGK